MNNLNLSFAPGIWKPRCILGQHRQDTVGRAPENENTTFNPSEYVSIKIIEYEKEVYFRNCQSLEHEVRE